MQYRLTPTKYLQIQRLALRGCRTWEIARSLGVAMSLVHKVRQGRYQLAANSARPDDAKPHNEPHDARGQSEWCPSCRCHVYAPCVMCNLRRRTRDNRRQADGNSHRASQIGDGDLNENLAHGIAELPLPLRVVNSLQQRGIFTVGDLLQWTPARLLRIPDFAEKSLGQVFRALAGLGFRRAGDVRAAG